MSQPSDDPTPPTTGAAPEPAASAGTSTSAPTPSSHGLWLGAGILGLVYGGLMAIQLLIWWSEFGGAITVEDALRLIGALLAALAGILVLMRITAGVPWLLIGALIAGEILGRGLSASGWFWTWPWEYASSYQDNLEQFGALFVVAWVLRGLAPYALLIAIVLAFIAAIRTERARAARPAVSTESG